MKVSLFYSFRKVKSTEITHVFIVATLGIDAKTTIRGSVGYFANAQYNVLLLPPSGEVSATPTIGDKSAR